LYREAIEDGSASVDDLLNQGSSTAYQHAMTAPGQNAADAKQAMCQFVNENLNSYRALTSPGTDAAAQVQGYRALGRALHPIMDSTSPAHMGWQVWGDPLEPGWWGEWRTHGDNSKSIEDLAHLTPALLAETLNRMQQAMNGSGACGCQK
jgi:hypothetical protein